MNATKEVLLECEKSFKEKRSRDHSLRSLLSTLHSDVQLQYQVTLESRALIPMITHRQGQTYINVLLAIPVIGANSATELQTPWAYVAWNWESRTVVQFEKLAAVYGLKPRTFTQADIVNATRADEIETALKNHREIPKLPRNLEEMYSDLAKLRRHWMVSPTENDLVESKPNIPASVVAKDSLELIQTMERILNHYEFRTEQTKLAALKDRLGRRGTTVCIIGDLGSGKSQLINNLIGRPILPVKSIVDLHQALVQIRPGPTEELIYTHEGKQICRVPLSDAGWKECSEQPVFPKGLIDARILGIPFLDTGIRLLEVRYDKTPSGPVTEALGNCDLAVVTISALTPLSLTDSALLEELVTTAKTPHVAVIITRLDQIESNERATVYQYIKNRLDRFKEKIVIGISLKQEEMPTATLTGPDELRAQLVAWSQSPDRSRLLLEKTMSELAQIGSNGMAKCKGWHTASLLQKSQREAAVTAMRDQLQKLRLDWADMRLEMTKRALEASEEIHAWLIATKADLLDQLIPELNSQPDPRNWWMNILPFRLRKVAAALGREAEDRLQRRIYADVRALQDEAWKITNKRLTLSSEKVGVDLKGLATRSDEGSLADLKRQRMYARIGLGGASMAAYLLAGPFGAVVSLGGSILADTQFEQKIEGQKKLLAQKLDQAVERVLVEASAQIRGRVGQVYDKLHAQLESEERDWLKAQLDGLKAPTEDSQQQNELKERMRTLEHFLTTLHV